MTALRNLHAPGADSDELQWLQFQIGELSALALAPLQYEALSEEHRRLAGSDSLRTAVAQAGELLHGAEVDAQSLLAQALAQLRTLRQGEPPIDAAIAGLQQASADLEDIARDLHRYQQQLRPDPERLAEMDDQLARIHAAARKHRVAPNELIEVQEKLQNKLAARLDAEALRPRLQAEADQTHARFLAHADQLARLRHAATQSFSSAVRDAVRRLGMPRAEFVLRWFADEGSHGVESVEFLVSTNPELPVAPLQRVASGGELSRISLAIQTIAAARSRIPTLVLDEADSGIGGAVAEIVGQTLRRLGQHTQILCVTHVPQVAAQGTHHLQVRKDDAGTHIDTLDIPARVSELARMIGGTRITSKTLARAEEMIRLASDADAEPAA